MTNYTDTQLKIALAKMLPELVCIKHYDCKCAHCLEHFPNGTDVLSYIKNTVAISDSELLHLCWLVEETLTNDQWFAYHPTLIMLTKPSATHVADSFTCHSPWQQRTSALAKVKGVKIV